MNSRTLATLGATLLLALGSSGCGPDGEGGAASAPGASESSTGSEEQAPDESSTPDESSPAVEPATGLELRLKKVSLRVPTGWKQTRIPSNIGLMAYPGMEMDVFLTSFTDPGEWVTTFEMHAENQLESYTWRVGRPRRLDDVEVDGVKMFHVVGAQEKGIYAERFGTVHADQQIGITFEFDRSVAVAERDQVIHSVLASVDFRE